MPEHLTPEQRHYNMAAIRAKDTKPEIVVRKYLWSHGFRYRLNHRRLPGKPDIVLRKYRTCIFVNGCFWHGHKVILNDDVDLNDNVNYGGVQSSVCCKIPKTRRDFWLKKIVRNKQRDAEVTNKLTAMGWHCITIWECELKSQNRQATLESLVFTLSRILLDEHRVRKYEFEDSEPYMVADDCTVEDGFE